MSNDSSNVPVDDKASTEPAKPEQSPKPVTVKQVPWSPWMAVLLTILVYYAAQYAASFLLVIYPRVRGWDSVAATNWLTNSVVAQFFYVLLAEALTFGAIWWFLRRRKASLRDIGWHKPKAWDPLFTLCGFVVYYVVFAALLAVVTRLFPSIDVNQKQQLGFQNASGAMSLILTFLSLCILPPLVEETVFRGFVFTGLRTKLHWAWAAVLTSLLFATAHLELGSGQPPLWTAAVDTFTLSLVLCFLRQKTDRLWPGIFLHALKNSVAFIALFIIH